MRITRSLVSLLLLTASAAACGEGAEDPVGTIPTPTRTAVRVVNAVTAPVDVAVDGAVVQRDVPATSVSTVLGVTAGTHAVQLRRPGETTGPTLTVTVAAGDTSTVAAVPGAGLEAMALSDTGSAPVAGRSKLRVVHLADGAPAIDVWRTQPDFPTPVRVMFPFAYRAESSYIQSTPGTWTVFVTPADQGQPILATSGPITVGDGQVRTVVILDGPNGELRVVPID